MKAIGLFILALMTAAPAMAGSRVVLKDELAVAGAEIRLGDLFDDAGAASGVIVARATGSTVVLDARSVQAVAARQGLDWANPNGFRELVVKAQPPAAAPPATLAVAAEPRAPVARQPAAAPAEERMVQALTWARDLPAGELVRAEDVIWAKVPARQQTADSARDADVVVGQAARHALREGAVVSNRDLSPPKVIRRDQEVEVVFAMDGVRLVLSGRALADACVGDPVQVLNTQSKKTIEAVASGPGRALVGPDAEARRTNRLAALN